MDPLLLVQCLLVFDFFSKMKDETRKATTVAAIVQDCSKVSYHAHQQVRYLCLEGNGEALIGDLVRSFM